MNIWFKGNVITCRCENFKIPKILTKNICISITHFFTNCENINVFVVFPQMIIRPNVMYVMV